MRFLIMAIILLSIVASSSARAGIVNEEAFAWGARFSSNFNTPYDPPFDPGPSFALFPPGTLPAFFDGRGAGSFGDSALKFAMASVVPPGQSIVSATLTLNIASILPGTTGRDPSLTVSGFSADANKVSLADFNLASSIVGTASTFGSSGIGGPDPLPSLVFDVTAFLQTLQATGAASAGFRLDNLSGGTIVISAYNAPNPANQPFLSITLAATVPEPASIAMATMGLAIALGMARRRAGSTVA